VIGRSLKGGGCTWKEIKDIVLEGVRKEGMWRIEGDSKLEGEE
jgi:hypothetical protein